MTNPKHIAYERLKALHEEGESAHYAWTMSGKLQEWKLNVASALRRLYGGESEQLKAFNDNYDNYSSLLMVANLSRFKDYVEFFESTLTSALAIISSAIREYEDYEFLTQMEKT